MKLMIKAVLLTSAWIVASCKPALKMSTEEGIDFRNTNSVASTFKGLDKLKDPQLRNIARTNGAIQFWLVPNSFNIDQLHFCAYVGFDSDRPVSKNGNTDVVKKGDLDRFASSQVLKQGKYIEWFTFLDVFAHEFNSGEGDSETIGYFRDTLKVLNAEKKKWDGPLATVLEDMDVRRPIKKLGFIPDTRNRPESQLAGLLLALDRVKTTKDVCPNPMNVIKKSEISCPDNQVLVNHNRGDGWICVGDAAVREFGDDDPPSLDCKKHGKGFFRKYSRGDIHVKGTWECVSPLIK